MNVKDKIIESIELLDEIDNYNDSLNDQLSECDSKLSDLYHYIETNKLKTNECYRMIQELRKVLLARRKIKDDICLFSTYNKEKNRLINNSNRIFLKQEISKKNKELIESSYKNRIYSDEELNKILGRNNIENWKTMIL